MTTDTAPSTPAESLLHVAAQLRDEVGKLRFSEPVAHVYNPLAYAWETHANYLRRFGTTKKRVVFLGMNPGPWGMVQTGVPFGEVQAVKDWLGITGSIFSPEREHPKRPIQGFACTRTEVSGKRVWGLFADRFKTAEAFFDEHFVVNYCPLAFLEESGRNRTPDKLPAREVNALYEACDRHVRQLLAILQPEWLIGIGAFAEARCRLIAEGSPVQLGRILHPSPASPAANRDWAGAATHQLQELNVWPK